MSYKVLLIEDDPSIRQVISAALEIEGYVVHQFSDGESAVAEIAQVEGYPLLKWNVLNFDDLITSKIKSSRAKDLLDIQELKRLKKD